LTKLAHDGSDQAVLEFAAANNDFLQLLLPADFFCYRTFADGLQRCLQAFLTTACFPHHLACMFLDLNPMPTCSGSKFTYPNYAYGLDISSLVFFAIAEQARLLLGAYPNQHRLCDL
jgi:hypothetical protein